MRLDIRIPVGLLFLIFGLLLSGFGLISDKVLYHRSLEININLWWGVVMLVFGAVMLALGRRSHQRLSSNDSDAASTRTIASGQE